jgi:uncharacterized protein YbgA (DUF1722 family)/uncharacterized protein YbbK (DUF523 family)
MRHFAKPIIVCSKCLGFAACRWDGRIIQDTFVRQLKPFVRFKPICPECEIRLGIPREPIHIVLEKGKRKLIQPTTGKDYTARMAAFADKYLSSLGEVDGFILKSQSPSCGIRDVKIYGGKKNAHVIGSGGGFFAEAVVGKFPDAAIEDEKRLSNLRFREHFLSRIFALANWRQTRKSESMARLVEFHASNKLMLMAYNQKEMRILGRIVANQEKRTPKEVFADYGIYFKKAFGNAPRTTAKINVLMHALGYFKNDLKSAEKAEFLKELDKYRQGKIPLSILTGKLYQWVFKFDKDYLAKQTYLEPYPVELRLHNLNMG